MKLLTAKATNFGTYKTLDFNYENQGLSLIYGNTGSGKSALFDLPVWVLFGKTAKKGLADDVIRWGSTEPTVGHITLVTDKGAEITVTRSRGLKSKDNDFYYTTDQGVLRGKDATDTQKLLNTVLGFTADTYTAGSYYHEFSDLAKFYTAEASVRRKVMEQLADLSLPTTLGQKLVENLKKAEQEEQDTQAKVSFYKDQYRMVDANKDLETSRMELWDITQVKRIKDLQTRFDNFDKDKEIQAASLRERLEALVKKEQDSRLSLLAFEISYKELQAVCEHCGAFKDHKTHTTLVSNIARLQTSIEDVVKNTERTEVLLKSVVRQTNTFGDLLEEAKAESNPHEARRAALMIQCQTLHNNVLKVEGQLIKAEKSINDLETLVTANNQLKNLLVQEVVEQVQDSTNELLVDFFDAELKVNMSVMEDTDKLEVIITKDGNEASYAQLSKGQRQMLKLCFSCAAMEVIACQSGVKFTSLFLDEPFDGLDASLKVKAFTFLQALELKHENVFVIEHSTELRPMFNNRFQVTNTGDGSECNPEV